MINILFKRFEAFLYVFGGIDYVKPEIEIYT